MTEITTIGEVLIDLTQTGVNGQNVPVFAANPGGAPPHRAGAAPRRGGTAPCIGNVGRDGFGAYLTGVLTENGVDASGVRADETPTTMAVVTVAPGGERSFRFVRGADALLTEGEVDTALIEGSKVLHFGSVSLTAEPARSATLFAARHAREHGVLVSYDPNYREALWPDQEEAVARMCAPLPLADVLKLSDEELPLLTGTDDPAEGTRRLADRGVSLVLLTLGGEGAFWRWQGETGLVPGVATAVADTNGAGDTFLGAVLSRLVRRGERPLEGLTVRELEDILAFANRAASKTCSRSGAIPAMPTLAELEAGEEAGR